MARLRIFLILAIIAVCPSGDLCAQSANERFANDAQTLDSLPGTLNGSQAAQAIMSLRDLEPLVSTVSAQLIHDWGAKLCIFSDSAIPGSVKDEAKILVGLLESRPEFLGSLTDSFDPSSAKRASLLNEIISLVSGKPDLERKAADALGDAFLKEGINTSTRCAIDAPLKSLFIAPDVIGVTEKYRVKVMLQTPAVCDMPGGPGFDVAIKGLAYKQQALMAIHQAIADLRNVIAASGISSVVPISGPMPNEKYFHRLEYLTGLLIGNPSFWSEVATFDPAQRDALTASLFDALGAEIDIDAAAPHFVSTCYDQGHASPCRVTYSDPIDNARMIFTFALHLGAAAKPLVPKLSELSDWGWGVEGLYFPQIIARIQAS